MMNLGAWMCGVLVIPFATVGLLFGLFKERATKFVAGFNSFTDKEQEMYDRAAISRDIRNQCLIWSALMLIGTVLSFIISPYMAIPTFIIWSFLFFKDTHMDPHKAFDKYLLK